MENFITGHLLCQEVDVYCGGQDKFTGTVAGCADGVLTLETGKGVYTHVAIDKIIAIWGKKETVPAAAESTKEVKKAVKAVKAKKKAKK
ncbi:hypothetical protein CUJ83_03995 [Methanocella sp. CWC-04]|uniref:Uncharacterized protein n=1 Tax=Methanooceanicella nereidis TaxID=2052831 RepID=A0AAP2RCL0_9EURY|nr:hypothetical protein [Methanocella sp. CWC-04]